MKKLIDIINEGHKGCNKSAIKKFASRLTLDFLAKNKKVKKVKESKINESLVGSEYIDTDELEKIIKNLYEETVDNWDSEYKDALYDYVEEVTPITVESIARDMKKYCNSSNHNMSGNFANIEDDYERKFKGKNFNEVIKKINNKVEDEDTKEFRSWSVDWFFYAFGTWGLKYNFETLLGEVEYAWKKEDGVED